MITFSSAPQVMTTPLPTLTGVNENNNIDITCESDGWPEAEITWYKGSSELSDEGSEYYSIRNSEEPLKDGTVRAKSVLTWFKVNRDKADTYTCKAKSDVNSVESSTQLVVRCK